MHFVLGPGPQFNDSLSLHTHRPRPVRLPSVCHSHAHQSVTGLECEMVQSEADPKAKGLPATKCRVFKM
jgi:hypothetical protein